MAHASGAVVALTAGDANVVNRHRQQIWDVLIQGVDILFANRWGTSDDVFVCTTACF